MDSSFLVSGFCCCRWLCNCSVPSIFKLDLISVRFHFVEPTTGMIRASRRSYVNNCERAFALGIRLVRMDSAIDASTPLDYIEFQIFPSQNRYEAWVCYGTNIEKVSSGLLEHLLLHSAEIKALHSKGSNAKYKLSASENSNDIKWFKRSTLIRFLHIVGSENILDVTNSLKMEIFQLEETRNLYTKDSKYLLQSSQSGQFHQFCVLTILLLRNELLQAMDLRLTALRGKLLSAFDQASASQYSLDEMTEIQKLSLLFGANNLSDSLCKYIELRRGTSSKHLSERDKVGPQELNSQTNKPSSTETPVKYAASPAKAAQAERQSSTESEDESSFSSDQDQQTFVERSRALIRSASPRRSASPMRRVQIGRSGARRPTAITIKSLNYIPPRERSFFTRDEDHSGEEESEQVPKKSESNITRMSVQDAINLFESKQRDQRGDVQKAKSLLNANKSVLRRWSSGMGEDPSRSSEDTSLEGIEVQNNVQNNEARSSSPDFESVNPVETCEDGPLENGACSPELKQEETHETEVQTEVNEKSNASAEWSRQKEAELNELFMKMMETKPVKSRGDVADGSKRQSLPSEQRGGYYGLYNEKREEKLREQTAKKKAEKGKQPRSTQKTLDVKKSKLTPTSTAEENKKGNVKKIQNPVKSSVSQPANLKTEKSPRPGIVKKGLSKASSSLPSTRKSWPSIPSARATGLSPVKTPPSTSTNPTPTRRRSQPTPPPPVSQSSSRVETSQARAKSTKSSHNDSKKVQKTDPEKKQLSLTKPRKTAKSKVVEATPPKDLTPSTKPSLYSKVTKKSSVVPLESKPFLRKSSKTTTSGTNPVLRKKLSHPQELSRKPEDPTPPEEDAPSLNSSDPATPHEEEVIEGPNIETVTGPGPTTPRSLDKCEDGGFRQVSSTTDFSIERLVEPELKSEAEDELTISPSAWVEMEENEDHSVTPIDHDIGRVVDAQADITPAKVPSPRVRHSLSQMLLEESSEPDFVDWGNAENPPAMAYQKDAPKGLKRLLKFARKSKNEANATGWSSPSLISEGEDDADDSRLTSKRTAENLLRKATHQSMNNCHQKSSADYDNSAHPNISKLNDQSLAHHFQQGQVSASVTTTKATRSSFFSLSAFKGSK
ncbi:hypothetical protein STAS_28184 [Striga asiatica]|uniref:Uncharacterized protein n=1 Tax=Striga asiatica TaxID=4170 RepID=A0A5A7R0N3_STRAF|nr:hypothetical protein STAS_28184 [Striga asiatica]